MKVKSESEVAQSYQILRDPMDCSLSGSSIHGVFQARVLECGAIAFHIVSKRVHQGCILSSCLFNFYAEYIMGNPGLGESQAGIKIVAEISTTSDIQIIPL